MNTYGYVGGNPLVFYDSLGLKPGDKFATVNDAIQDAKNYVFEGKLVRSIFEFGGLVSKVGDCYTYDLITGDGDTLNLADIRPNGLRSNDVATYHSHTDGGGEDFTVLMKDIDRNGNAYYSGDYYATFNSGVPGYLFTPSGVIKRLDPKTFDETIIPPSKPTGCGCGG